MIKNFYPLLIGGNIEELLDMFSGEPLLNEPSKGVIHGRERFEHFLGNYIQWMQRRNPRVEHLVSTITSARAVEECTLHLEYKEERWRLPVAIVGDLSDNKFTHIRIYYSMLPFFNEHSVRSPILPDKENLRFPPFTQKTLDALDKGDTDAVISTFEPFGYLKEPSGDRRHEGVEGLRKFYGSALAHGGIKQKTCTCTYDGIRCAVEFNIYQWGHSALSPQAGCAVFEQSQNGRLIAVRLYDDLERPDLNGSLTTPPCTGGPLGCLDY